MHPVETCARRKRTVLVLVLALGASLPPPAQAYLLDFTVASVNPAVLISYAGGSPSAPPLVAGNPKASDVSLRGDRRRQFSPTSTLPNKILNSATGPLGVNLPPVPAAATVWPLGALSPQGSIILHASMPGLTMPGAASPLRDGFGIASVTEPAPASGNAFGYLAGSNFTDHKNDAWEASLGLQRHSADDTFDPGVAASFASASDALATTMVAGGDMLNRLAPFSSTLLLLGCGLMGLLGLRYRRRRG
jgi:hypothetical protein